MNIIQCPHCMGEIDLQQVPLEEIAQSNAMIIRKSEDRSSWQEIADIIHSGRATMLFNVGDSVQCELKDGTRVVIDVAGINTYNDNEVIFCFRDVYWEHYMNPRNTNSGGYAKSEMAEYLDNDIFTLLPDDLQSAIKPRNIRQNIKSTLYERECKLWLPSIYEIAGEQHKEYGSDIDDKHLELFQNKRNRIKYDRNNVRQYWWERSPGVAGSTYFVNVINGGSAYSGDNASYANGVVPCFSI